MISTIDFNRKTLTIYLHSPRMVEKDCFCHFATVAHHRARLVLQLRAVCTLVKAVCYEEVPVQCIEPNGLRICDF